MRFSRNSASDQIEALKREGEERDAERRAAAEGIPYLKDNPVASKDAVIVIEEENARAANLAVVARDDKKLTAIRPANNTSTRTITPVVPMLMYRLRLKLVHPTLTTL